MANNCKKQQNEKKKKNKPVKGTFMMSHHDKVRHLKALLTVARRQWMRVKSTDKQDTNDTLLVSLVTR